MAGMSAYEIYNAIHGGPGSGSLHDAGRTAAVESKTEEERAKRINQLAAKIEAGWQGQAGAAAFGAARPIAVVSMVGAANLEITHRLLNQQTHSFDTAKSNVIPVSEKPPETGIIDDLSPWETDTEDEAKKHQADSDHNIRVYGQYDQQSWDNETALPMDYSTLQDPGGEIIIRKPEEPQPHPREPGPGGDDTTTPPGGGDDRRTPPTPPPGDDTTKPQWQDPTKPQFDDPRNPPVNPPGRPPIPTPPPTPPGLPPFTPPGMPPYGPPGQGTGRGPGGQGTGRGPGGSGVGRGPGGTGMGPRPGGYGPGGPGAIGAKEPGARAGAGAHDPHAQGRGAAGASGGQGRGGMGGGMGAGGRGQGGEDEEHTRASFLQEDDPEAIFGTDQVTAPPVIGE